MTPKQIAQRVLDSIQPPRPETIVAIVAYTVTIFGGLALLMNAADLLQAWSQWLGFVTGGAMVILAVAGIPLAWTGRWWLERGVAIGLAGGYTATGLMVFLVDQRHGLRLPGFTTALVVITICAFLIRFTQCSSRAYESRTRSGHSPEWTKETLERTQDRANETARAIMEDTITKTPRRDA